MSTTATDTYADVPLPKSKYGRTYYEKGRELIAAHGVVMREVVWDADEVLWDWVMDLSGMVRAIPRLIRADLSHREYFRVKPGVFELIWGMHHESKERGADPYMRVWTDGYPWRMWRINQLLPALSVPLGPGPDGLPDDPHSFRHHPRLFSRTDFVYAIEALLAAYEADKDLRVVPEAVRADVVRRLIEGKFGATWKLPELAEIAGKPGFADSRCLIDDNPRNVRVFVSTGRRAIEIENPNPHVFFGKVPNSVWSDPEGCLERLANAIAEPLSEALRLMTTAPAGMTIRIKSTEPVPDYDAQSFRLDVPDKRIRSEWIQPIRKIKRMHAEIIGD